MIVKRGDTHTIEWTVGSGGTAVSLTDATVRLLVRRVPDGDVEELTASVSDAQNGKVSHTLTGDLAVGTYDVEIEVTLNGEISTAPSSGYFTLYVLQDLG